MTKEEIEKVIEKRGYLHHTIGFVFQPFDVDDLVIHGIKHYAPNVTSIRTQYVYHTHPEHWREATSEEVKQYVGK